MSVPSSASSLSDQKPNGTAFAKRHSIVAPGRAG